MLLLLLSLWLKSYTIIRFFKHEYIFSAIYWIFVGRIVTLSFLSAAKCLLILAQPHFSLSWFLSRFSHTPTNIQLKLSVWCKYQCDLPGVCKNMACSIQWNRILLTSSILNHSTHCHSHLDLYDIRNIFETPTLFILLKLDIHILLFQTLKHFPISS